MIEPSASIGELRAVGHGITASPEISRQYRHRALLLWPRLDRTKLARTGGDPIRIAHLVARRSAQPIDVIVSMLTGVPLPARSWAGGDER